MVSTTTDNQRTLPALLANRAAGPIACTVTTTETTDAFTIEVAVPEAGTFTGQSAIDFDDALCQLRLELDAANVLLLCNRYRRNAFVSSLVRQMSGGLGCYLVEPNTTVDPEQVVESLGEAHPSEVVTKPENDAFVDNWIKSFQ